MKNKNSNSKDAESEVLLSDQNFIAAEAEAFPEESAHCLGSQQVDKMKNKNSNSKDAESEVLLSDQNFIAAEAEAFTEESAHCLGSQQASPSYESLDGKVRSRNKKSANIALVDFTVCKKLVGLIARCIAWILFLYFTRNAIQFIVIGSHYLHIRTCPAESYIPVWLVVGGIVAVLRDLFIAVFCCQTRNKVKRIESGKKEKAKKDEEEEECTPAGKIAALLDCLLVVWLIVGFMVVNPTQGDISTNPNAKNFCHPDLYWYAYYVLWGSLILSGIFILCIGMICCCGCCYVCWVGNDDELDDWC